MAAFKWTPQISVGVALIDTQHKTLFDKANALLEACNRAEGYTEIAKLFSYLEGYVIEHFRDEERYMTSIQYPELSAQKKAHAEFIASMAKTRRDYEASPSRNIAILTSALKLISDWLIKHISIDDRKIGQFAAAKGK